MNEIIILVFNEHWNTKYAKSNKNRRPHVNFGALLSTYRGRFEQIAKDSISELASKPSIRFNVSTSTTKVKDKIRLFILSRIRTNIHIIAVAHQTIWNVKVLFIHSRYICTHIRFSFFFILSLKFEFFLTIGFGIDFDRIVQVFCMQTSIYHTHYRID